MNQITERKWSECTFVAFDLETSGAYPKGSDIVEFGAVKWRQGSEVGTYQSLFKPQEPMSAFNIGIHGITNEMVADAPLINEKIHEIRAFLEGAVLLAHHAPFDLGFLAPVFEENGVPFPEGPVLCTSLLARKVIPESPNHKLQTLIKFLQLSGGTAHRGVDDARACLQLGLRCMERLGPTVLVCDLIKIVEKDLRWNRFSLASGLAGEKVEVFVKALAAKRDVDFIYAGGSLKGVRRITPQGIVRNPDGDYIQGICHIDRISKRFYLDKMQDMQLALF